MRSGDDVSGLWEKGFSEEAGLKQTITDDVKERLERCVLDHVGQEERARACR